MEQQFQPVFAEIEKIYEKKITELLKELAELVQPQKQHLHSKLKFIKSCHEIYKRMSWCYKHTLHLLIAGDVLIKQSIAY